MQAIETQRNQLSAVQKTVGPLTLTRSAEEHGGPHEPWFWDPTRHGGGVLSDMGCHGDVSHSPVRLRVQERCVHARPAVH